jgi:hypothetical protein
MANVAAPFGFRPVRMIDGSPFNGAVQRCSLDSGGSTDAFVGTPVVLTAAGDQYLGYGINAEGAIWPAVEVVAGGDNAIFGVIISFETDRSNLETMSHDASATTADRQCMVAVAAPSVVFEVETAAAHGVAGIGAHYDHSDETATVGTDTYSNCTLEVGGAGQWRLIGYRNSPDNDGTLDNAIAEVVCIRSQIGNEAVVAAV